MKSRLEQYVDNIIRHTECTKKEKDDLKEELLVHLELSRDELIKEGFSEKEAERKAMELFGKEGKIGHALQQSIFPYRKELILSLAASSLLMTVILYLLRLFVEGDAHFVWLWLSMVVGAMFLFLPLNRQIHFNYKRWLLSLLIVHILGQLYAWLLASSLQHDAQVGLTIWIWLNIALAIGLIYQTTIYDFHPNESALKWLHGMNITSGILIIGTTLFFIFGGLIMIGRLHPIMLLFASPTVIWAGLYVLQLKIMKRQRKTAFVLAFIPFIFALLVVIWMFVPSLYAELF